MRDDTSYRLRDLIILLCPAEEARNCMINLQYHVYFHRFEVLCPIKTNLRKSVLAKWNTAVSR